LSQRFRRGGNGDVALFPVSLRASLNRRQMQRALVAGGLQSLDDARRTGKYHDAADADTELEAMRVAAEKSHGNR
jgi:hypothetical protein